MSSENQMCKLRQLQKDRITDPGSGNRLKVGIHIGRAVCFGTVPFGVCDSN